LTPSLNSPFKAVVAQRCYSSIVIPNNLAVSGTTVFRSVRLPPADFVYSEKWQKRIFKILERKDDIIVRNHANRPQNKGIFITPSHDLFLTYRGEKWTVLLQYCTAINV
jgi:hypothetical protein